MLPQPFATATLAKNENLKVAVDMTDAWEKATDGTKLEMGCVVINKEWAEKNPTIVKSLWRHIKPRLKRSMLLMSVLLMMLWKQKLWIISRWLRRLFQIAVLFLLHRLTPRRPAKIF